MAALKRLRGRRALTKEQTVDVLYLYHRLRSENASGAQRRTADLLGYSAQTVALAVRTWEAGNCNEASLSSSSSSAAVRAAAKGNFLAKASRVPATRAVATLVREYVADEGRSGRRVAAAEVTGVLVREGHVSVRDAGGARDPKDWAAAVRATQRYLCAPGFERTQAGVMLQADVLRERTRFFSVLGGLRAAPAAERLREVYAGGSGGLLLAFARDGGVLVPVEGAARTVRASSAAAFILWWRQRLLPSLGSRPSVLVLDPSGGPGRRSPPADAPNPGAMSKEELLDAARARGLAVAERATAAHLRSALLLHLAANERPEAELLAEAAGHRVLYMPPHHADLDPAAAAAEFLEEARAGGAALAGAMPDAAARASQCAAAADAVIERNRTLDDGGGAGGEEEGAPLAPGHDLWFR